MGKPAILNPIFESKDVEGAITRLVFAGLTRPGGDGGVESDLASHWEITDDGREYRFFLRDNLTWHDGAPVTADDVVFTARLAADPRLRGSLSRIALPWSKARVEKLDSQTVTFHLDEAYAPFLGATTLGLLPVHLLADVPPTNLASHRFSTIEPVGAGPYRLAAPGGLTDTAARLERFDGYWENTARRPFVDSLILEFAAGADEAVEILGRQASQAAGGIPGAAIPGLSADTELHSSVRSGLTLIYLNLRQPLYHDAGLRRALSIAIDRQALVADFDVAAGPGVPASGPIPRGSWAFDPILRPPRFDPAAASQMLEDSGWVDSDGNGTRDREGRSLSISLGVPSDRVLLGVADRVRDHWAAIGVDVTIRAMDPLSARRLLTDHTFDAMMFDWMLSDYDPDPFPLWHSSQIDDGQNFASWSDAETDRLLVDARRATDRRERVALYRDFQRIFAREQPALALYYPVYTYGVAAGEVGGVQTPQLVVTPADRYYTLRDWYVETETVFLEGRSQ